jgi:hypothetical protein
MAASIGARIGSGHGSNGASVVTAVTLSNGVVDHTRDCGSGIGSGSEANGNATVARLTIVNGTFPSIAMVQGAGATSSGHSTVRALSFAGGSFKLRAWESALGFVDSLAISGRSFVAPDDIAAGIGRATE